MATNDHSLFVLVSINLFLPVLLHTIIPRMVNIDWLWLKLFLNSKVFFRLCDDEGVVLGVVEAIWLVVRWIGIGLLIIANVTSAFRRHLLVI